VRFHGAVGYADHNEETSPGVWQEVMTEISYTGDVIRNSGRLESNLATLNEDVTLANAFSIMADAYAYENFEKMRYLNWNGSNWRINSVEIQRPRLILTTGGLWNGNTPATP
jgi:hypothetical protein